MIYRKIRKNMKNTFYTTELINKEIQKYHRGEKIENIYYRNIEGLKNSMVFCHTHEELLEYAKCVNDPIYFFETYCNTQTCDGIRKITLRDYQKQIINDYIEKKFNIYAASRQTGMSTMIALIALYEAIFHKKSISLVNNKLCCSVEKLDNLKNIYKNLPFFLKPGVIRFDTRNIEFDNGSLISAVYYTNTVGHARDILFLDDFAHAIKTEAFMREIVPTILPSAKIMISSTPNGYNHFYEMFTNAHQGLNMFTPHSIYWWQVPGRDKEWKAREIKNLGSEDLFKQEYELQFFSARKNI
jgi:hypothetical protein